MVKSGYQFRYPNLLIAQKVMLSYFNEKLTLKNMGVEHIFFEIGSALYEI